MPQPSTQSVNLLVADGLHVELIGHVALVELRRPPHNFFDLGLITALANLLETLDGVTDCRAVVLGAQGSAFCAGADFSRDNANAVATRPIGISPLYNQALRLFATSKPLVAAVQGPAIGGGLGLALVADFRVSCPQARFAANFNRLGFHPGFGLSVTLPDLIGKQHAARLFYTGQRVDGVAAHAMGLVDELVPSQTDVTGSAMALAADIACSAPLAVQSTRSTMRAGLLPVLRRAMEHESGQQFDHFQTSDFKEGIAAMAERRSPRFASV